MAIHLATMAGTNGVVFSSSSTGPYPNPTALSVQVSVFVATCSCRPYSAAATEIHTL